MNTLFLVGATAGISTKLGPVGGGVRILEHLLETFPSFTSMPIVKVYANAVECRESCAWGESIGLKVPILESASAERLIQLSELQYSRFSCEFEQVSTEFLLKTAKTKDIILVNDISEGPHFTKLAQAGLIVVPLFHIAVAEFFCKLYLRDFFPAPQVARFFHFLEDKLGRWIVPKLLQLVFSKERDAVQSGSMLIVPSEGLKKALVDCYGATHEPKIKVVPWNLLELPEFPRETIDREIQRLREQYQIREEEQVWITLSRISWEKGIDVLLDAISELPQNSPFRLFICGEAAYMGGKKYLQKLKKQAQKWGHKVEFPGYVHGVTKEAFFRLTHLFLSTSHYEAYGLTLQEAILHEIPILSLDHHGSRQHETYLTLVPGQTRRERVQNLSKSLQNPPQKKSDFKPEALLSAPKQILDHLRSIQALDSR